LNRPIRALERRDVPALLGLIKELADYEKLTGIFANDAAQIATAFFAENPRVFCDVAEIAGEPVGYAIWFYSYSTFTGRHGIYLEDLYVRREHRGAGFGRAFIQSLASRCVAEGLTRLEWQVLDWNEPSIKFYRSLGALEMAGWTGFRVAGDALARLAAAKP
jgi:GNAT superfamily N-acetyltransferase